MDDQSFPPSPNNPSFLRKIPDQWSHSLFAGPGEKEPHFSWWTSFFPPLLLVVLAGFLFFARLGCPLLEPEEARYSEIPRQMLEQGNFVTPVLHGEDYYQKPPLLYWLVMLSYRLFGVHDWAARLVPSMAGIFTILLTYAWGRYTVGPRAGFASGLILCLSARYLYLAGMVGMDSLLCLWVVAGLAWGHWSMSPWGPVSNRSHRASWKLSPTSTTPSPPLTKGGAGGVAYLWLFLSAVSCGLGILTKGPVTAVLVVGPLAAFQFLDRRARRWPISGWLIYLAVVGAVAAPWYVAVSLRDQAATGTFFWLHNVVRYFAPFDHEQPAWFYLPSLVLGMLPWSLLLVPLVPYLARQSPRWSRRRPAALGMFLLAFLGCLGFFSLSGCKRPGYILPAFPALALILGTYLAQAFPWAYLLGSNQRAMETRMCPRVTGLCQRLGQGVWVLSLQMFGFVGWLAFTWGLWSLAGALVLTLVVNALSLGICLRRFQSARTPWLLGACCLAAWLLFAAHDLLPDYHRRFALRGQVRRHRELDVPVVCYPKRWDSVSFYLGRQVEVFTPQQRERMLARFENSGETLVFVKREKGYGDFLKGLAPTLEFTPYGRQGWNVLSGIVRKK